MKDGTLNPNEIKIEGLETVEEKLQKEVKLKCIYITDNKSNCIISSDGGGQETR